MDAVYAMIDDTDRATDLFMKAVDPTTDETFGSATQETE